MTVPHRPPITHRCATLVLALTIPGACAPLGVESLVDDVDDPDAEACEHFTSGPFAHHVAGADQATAPDLSATHVAHRIDLLPGAGGYQGAVSIAVRDAGDLRIYLDARIELTLSDGRDVTIAPESRCPSPCSASCSALADRFLYELPVGSYAVRLGPTPTPTVSLAHETAADHHEHGP